MQLSGKNVLFLSFEELRSQTSVGIGHNFIEFFDKKRVLLQVTCGLISDFPHQFEIALL